jgi:uncharacterized RDD family membrane protein YckC
MEDQYPSLLTRMMSLFFDTLVLVVSMLVFARILDEFPNAPDWLRMALFFSIFFAYEPLCLTYGCTIGNFLMRIRVRQFRETNSRITLPNAILRFIVKACLGWISFVTIHSNPERRAIHDMAAGSVMIIYQKKTALANIPDTI